MSREVEVNLKDIDTIYRCASCGHQHLGYDLSPIMIRGVLAICCEKCSGLDFFVLSPADLQAEATTAEAAYTHIIANPPKFN